MSLSIEGSTSLKLKTSDQWRNWLASIRNIAKSQRIWNHIDPDLEEQPVVNEPTYPSVSDAQLGASNVRDLGSTGAMIWTDMKEDYRFQKKEFDNINDALTRMLRIVQESVAPENFHYIADCESPYEQLTSLKAVFAPTKAERKLELKEEWRSHRDMNQRSMNLEAWIKRWESLYEECVGADVAGVKDELEANHDFLLAIKPLHPSFYDIWYQRIVLDEDKISFHRLVRTFRAQYNTGKDRQKPSKVSFATLHGQKQNQSASSTSESPSKKGSRVGLVCPACGGPHKLHSCWYLNPEAWPSVWSPI